MSSWPPIVFHICAGTIALVSGAVAMSLQKGSRRHGLAVFRIRFRGVAFCCGGRSHAGARRCFWRKVDRAPPLTDVFRFFDRRVFVFPRPAKSNARVYARIEAAFCAASADTNSVDLLAVSRVVHEGIQAQIDGCQGDNCSVIAPVGFFCWVGVIPIPIFVRSFS
jgi:hypothetical protein